MIAALGYFGSFLVVVGLLALCAGVGGVLGWWGVLEEPETSRRVLEEHLRTGRFG